LKKIAVSVLAALLMAVGLVTLTTTPASAVCSSYAGCVDTRTVASGPKVVARKKRAQLCGTTTAVGSTVKPSGNMQFVLTRNRGGRATSKVVPYYGGKICITSRKLKKRGGYTVQVTFVPLNGSLFNPSSGSHGFDVAG
jgi:hypothetical protein